MAGSRSCPSNSPSRAGRPRHCTVDPSPRTIPDQLSFYTRECDSRYSPEGPRPEGAWFMSSAAIAQTKQQYNTSHLFPPKNKRSKPNISGTCSTPGGIETSLPRAPRLTGNPPWLTIQVRGYWAEYLLILCRGPTPITPLFAVRLCCAPPIMLVL